MTKEQEDGFVKLHWRFIRSTGKKLGPIAGWLLCALASRADQNGICYPSNYRLSQDTGISISAIVTAKKLLKKHHLIDYWNRKNTEGKTTSQGYKVYPLKAPESVMKDPVGATGDLKEIFNNLSMLEEKYSEEAKYLRANPNLISHMKILKETLSAARRAKIKDLDTLRLYYALSTFHTLRMEGRRIKKPFYAKLNGNVEQLARFAGFMVQASERLECPYEDAVIKFMGWVKERKRSKTLNFGIIPLLGDEWLEGLE